MNPVTTDQASIQQTGYDAQLFEERMMGYEQSENAFIYQDEIGKYIQKQSFTPHLEDMREDSQQKTNCQSI
ncbi:MAG: hypothetical protein AAFQ83_26370 [Bacteroidota bacterium]